LSLRAVEEVVRSAGVSHAIRADRRQMFLLPPNLDDWLPKEHPVRFIADLVDSLDLSELGFRQPSPGEDGRPHYAAELLLSVWLYGWMDRVRSSRALEKACLRDLAFVWLTGNQHPDHNTLWRFFRDNRNAFRILFKKTVQVAVKANLVGFALHALDGTKVQAASSTDTALHRRAMQEQLKQLDQVIDASVQCIDAAETQPEAAYTMPEALRDAKQRREQIRQSLRELDAADTDHMHTAEREARTMKIRGHNSALGYNAQVIVDHDSDLIVCTDVTVEQADSAQLVPMLQQMLDEQGRVADQTIADAGYTSGAQLDEAERRHLPVIVGFQTQAGEDGPYAKATFQYDCERNVYICPRDETLPFIRTESPSEKGKPVPIHIYRCGNTTCPVRGECTTSKRGREIKRMEYEGSVERQRERQKPYAMQVLLELRKEIVEHIFGILKGTDGFRRFTVRGLEAVRAQWALACSALNLRKLYAVWATGGQRLLSSG